MNRFLLAGAFAGALAAHPQALPLSADLAGVDEVSAALVDQWTAPADLAEQPAPAPTPTPAPGLQPTAALALKAGDYLWQPGAVRPGPVRIDVSIEKQLAFVYRGERLIGISTVSTGRRGHATPRGHFPILQKHARHFSNLYDNAPMPFMQRLTTDGVALHAGRIPGYPASHGCVRLPHDFARTLFAVTGLGTVVTIA